MLTIQRPDGRVRLYVTKDGRGGRPALGQMAVDCHAIGFIKGDEDMDVERLRQMAVAGGLAGKPDPVDAPWIPISACVETASGYVYTEVPTASKEPQVEFSSKEARTIKGWCNEFPEARRDAHWLVTLNKSNASRTSKIGPIQLRTFALS